MLVDSHCHLDRIDIDHYPDKLAGAIAKAKELGVEHFLTVCVMLEEFPNVLDIAKAFDCVSCSVGVHPTDGENEIVDTDELVELAKHPKVVALGETGLDYYRSSAEVLAIQQENFRQHIRAGHLAKKPLIIHTRMASNDTLKIMREEKADEVGGVMHCFTEGMDIAKAAMDLGFYISISGIVTFKKAEIVQYVAKNVPLDRLLIETDAPYLAPVPHRGKPNEPAYVRYTAEYIAALRGIALEDLAEQTTQNFYKLFNPIKAV